MDKRIKDIIEYVVIIIAVLAFRQFLYSPIRVSGDSMVPTLNDGDIMILDKIGYKINGLDNNTATIIITYSIISFILLSMSIYQK